KSTSGLDVMFATVKLFGQTPSTYLVFAHGNATNISEMDLYFKSIAYKFNIGVVLVEYPGYDNAADFENPSLNCSEQKCYDAFATAVDYVQTTIKPREIILMGQSLG